MEDENPLSVECAPPSDVATGSAWLFKPRSWTPITLAANSGGYTSTGRGARPWRCPPPPRHSQTQGCFLPLLSQLCFAGPEARLPVSNAPSSPGPHTSAGGSGRGAALPGACRTSFHGAEWRERPPSKVEGLRGRVRGGKHTDTNRQPGDVQ